MAVISIYYWSGREDLGRRSSEPHAIADDFITTRFYVSI